jgi:hypothetical protein
MTSTHTAPPANPPQPSGPESTDRSFLYQFSGQSEAPDTWTADAAYPADTRVPYTLTSKAETLLADPGNPTGRSPDTHARDVATRPSQPRPGPGRQPPAYVTEISVPPFDNGIQRLHSRMKQPEPEPEAGL